MNTNTTTRGREAETLAWHYLQSRGLRLLQRNYRSRGGEIDLVLQDRDSLVFVEVRYRRGTRFGSGAESVDRHKQSKLVACARHYLQTYPSLARQPCRFDVVSVSGTGASIEWIRDAFAAGD
ncbi:MAG TPA: YraN family protein [Gammaproteobacteria bacterium]|nr:YraN family protein [Gammaproteobacteria bacterium]